jgi:predicted phosphodiesterase
MGKMTGLTWLHLSDWHQKATTGLDRRVVRDAMIKDIKNRAEIHPDLATIDFIIFSGDLACSGKSEEYQEAQEQLLDPLLEACDLSRQQLFIVPGNHDLDRDSLNLAPEGFYNLLGSYGSIKDCLEARECQERILEPFEAFNSFVQGYNEQDHPNYACIKLMPDKNIALLGLNSAWACGHNKDKSGNIDDRFFVFIGEHQVYDPLESIPEAWNKIAVLHHTFEWLNKTDSDAVMGWLKEKCDFILQGHQHRSNVEVIHSPNGSCTIMPAGSCYNRRKTEDLHYASSYNFVHFDSNSKDFVAFFRRWSEPRKRWVEDVDSCDHGKWEFPSTLDIDRQPPAVTPRPYSIPQKVMISLSSNPQLQGRRYSSIQEAVNAAEERNIIMVEGGTYSEIINIDKSLTINGAGPGETIVDGYQNGSVFTVGAPNNRDIEVNLSGMTIKGGIGTSIQVNDNDGEVQYMCGGGILNYGKLTITDSTIFNNTAFNGAGIFNGKILTLNNTIVTQNVANNGGGIFNNRGSNNIVTVNLNRGSSIEDNEATGNGGGINSGGNSLSGNNVNLYPGSTISGNIAKNYGGGIWIFLGELNLYGGEISNNTGWGGGGIYNYGGDANLRGGSIFNNIAMNGAGIVNASGGRVTMEGAIISGNTANRDDHGLGGGIENVGKVSLISGSINNNIAFTDGGGIYNSGRGEVIGNRALVHDNIVISRVLNDITEPCP